jgi:integrase-like protein
VTASEDVPHDVIDDVLVVPSQLLTVEALQRRLESATYASEDYQAVLEAHGITCSMSRRGNCYDNAVMESFFSSVKSEVADRFESCGEAKMELFDYIEVFYNQRRRHSTLGQISPAAYEQRAIWEGMDAMENCTDRSFPQRPHPSVFIGTEERRTTQTT